MKVHDLHSQTQVLRVIPPVAIGTTGTGQTGKIIDRQGFDGVEFLVSYGAITGATAVFTVGVKEGDVTGTLTSVADQDMVGTELAASLASGARASGTTMKVSKKIGYKGTKRYVQLNIKSTVTAAVLVSAEALLFNPASTSSLP